MKITSSYLKKIIKEELQRELDEELIFDSEKSKDKKYIEVVRLDKELGRGYIGPHSMKASDMWEIFPGEDEETDKRRSELSDEFYKIRQKAEKQPSPDVDFDADEWEKVTWDNRRAANKRPFYFAFPDVQSAKKWFGEKQLKILINVFGFQLRKVKAKKAWLSKSKKQILFEPYTGLDDGKIINLGE